MKRQIIAVAVFGLMIGLVSPIFVSAQQSRASPRAAEQSESVKELTTRLEQRKATQKTRLNTTEANRLSGRCGAAQQKLTATTKKFSDGDKPFQAKYETYLARLQKIIQKAEAKDADTTDLKKNVDEFNQKYQAMVVSINEFNLSVSDLKSVDCKSNPVAFKATLESARTELKQVQAARSELSKLAKGPLLESIKSLKTSLEKS